MKKIDVLEMRNVEAGDSKKLFAYDDNKLAFNIGNLNIRFSQSTLGFWFFDKIQWNVDGGNEYGNGTSLPSKGTNHLYWNPWKFYAAVIDYVFDSGRY